MTSREIELMIFVLSSFDSMIRFISESEQPCDVFRNRIELTKTDNAIKRLIVASCVIKLPLTFSTRSNGYTFANI